MAKSVAGFPGFRPAAYEFLAGLAANNTRAWFAEHKAIYEAEVIAPFRLLLADVISGLAAAEIPLTGDPAKAIFRIHRDVRFSKDKLPYKIHAGAVLRKINGSRFDGILYLHIDPAGDRLAAGFYLPEKEALEALREAIYVDPARFAAMQADLRRAGLELNTTETLSRLPRGFEDAAHSPVADALRLKSFTVSRDLSRAELAKPAVVKKIVQFARDAEPLLRLGWQALTVLDPTALARRR